MAFVAHSQTTVIKPLEEQHVHQAFELIQRNKDYLMQWLPWVQRHNTIEDTLFMIQNGVNHYTRHLGMLAGIWYGDTLIGMVRHEELDRANGTAQLAIWIDQEYQGCGLATRAMRSMIHYSFEVLNLRRVEFRTSAANPRALALAQRLGFTHEGTLRQAVSINGQRMNVEVYGLLLDDWLTH